MLAACSSSWLGWLDVRTRCCCPRRRLAGEKTRSQVGHTGEERRGRGWNESLDSLAQANVRVLPLKLCSPAVLSFCPLAVDERALHTVQPPLQCRAVKGRLCGGNARAVRLARKFGGPDSRGQPHLDQICRPAYAYTACRPALQLYTTGLSLASSLPLCSACTATGRCCSSRPRSASCARSHTTDRAQADGLYVRALMCSALRSVLY